MAEDRWLVCPFCGWGKKYITQKQTNTLDRTVPGKDPFIDHRDVHGGRGSGFPRISFETLNDVKDLDQYKELIDGLRKQCKAVLEIIGD